MWELSLRDLLLLRYYRDHKMKITKQKLKEIIREELEAAEVEEEDFFWPGTEGVPNLSPEDVWQNIVNLRKNLSVYQAVINGFMDEYGEFVHVNTYAKMADAALAKLNDKLEGAILRTRESHPDDPHEELG